MKHYYLKSFLLFVGFCIIVACSSKLPLASEKLKDEKDTLEAMIATIVSINNNSEMRKAGVSKLVESYPDFLGGLNAEVVTNEELVLRLEQVRKLYDAKIESQIAQEKLDSLLELQK